MYLIIRANVDGWGSLIIRQGSYQGVLWKNVSQATILLLFRNVFKRRLCKQWCLVLETNHSRAVCQVIMYGCLDKHYKAKDW